MHVLVYSDLLVALDYFEISKKKKKNEPKQCRLLHHVSSLPPFLQLTFASSVFRFDHFTIINHGDRSDPVQASSLCTALFIFQ